MNAKPAFVSLGLAVALAAGCRSREQAPTAEPSTAAPAIASAADASAAAPLRAGAPVREGNVLARSAAGDALFLADEDHRVLRRIPLDPQIAAAALPLPGAPAQVLVLDDRILVTVRDPGLLLILRYAPATGFVELARVPLPADAWGLAVTPDEKLALVTSAWTHQVSAVDLATATKRWSIDVPREPRAIVIRDDGAGAYVTHLVGANLTRLSDLDKTTPKSSPLVLPAAPHRAPPGRVLDASLAYSAVLVDAGERLLVPRHALGAVGTNVWYGSPTVDVLLTKDDAPLAPEHDEATLAQSLGEVSAGYRDGPSRFADPIEPSPEQELAQPRAAVYLRTRGSILVAPEGRDRLFELNALAPDPARDRRSTIALGGGCSAPTGLAVSADEGTAYVFCRGSYTLATVRLHEGQSGTPIVQTARVVEDALPEAAALGRRIFYDASERAFSGGLACSGCHPEGRDDGHTYYEAGVGAASNNFLGLPENAEGTSPNSDGFARQTPMLAGRVGAQGPYGWHAQDKDLFYRLRAGVELHRWQGNDGGLSYDYRPKLNALIAFVRTGLVPPPRETRELTAIEAQGKAVFQSPVTGCATCHVPATEYTDRTAYPLRALPTLRGFQEEPARDFKTPSLLFVGGSAPYFHDGSVATLERLIDGNDDRMGKTNQLTKGERAALVAFLRTL